MLTMIKYFVIIWSIFVTFGQKEIVANDQSVLSLLPSTIGLQFPLEIKGNEIAPNVIGEGVQKIPCPIFSQRRMENPNIPNEQPWATVNKWNSVAPAPRRSNAEDPTSRRANVENPESRRSNSKDSASRNPEDEIHESWKFIADDPLRRSNADDFQSRRSQAEEPSSRRLIANDPISRRFNVEDYMSRRSNTANPMSRRSNSEDNASRNPIEEIPESLFIADDPLRRSNADALQSRRSQTEEPSSRRLIANDPISRRFNAEDYMSRRSNVANPMSRRSNSEDYASRKAIEEIPESIFIADDPISRKSNTEGATRNFYAGVPTSRRYSEQFPASRRYPWQTVDSLRQTPDDNDNHSNVLSLFNDQRTQPYTNDVQTQLRREDVYGPPPSLAQPLYNAWQVLSTTNPSQGPNRLDEQTTSNVLNVPSPNGDVQVLPLINYPVEITTPNPSKPTNPSDCNPKTKQSDVNEPLSEIRREEGTSRRIMPGILPLKQVSTPASINLSKNSPLDVTTMSSKLNVNGEKIADTRTENVENVGRTNVPQATSKEENEDRMSIADIEQQLMEPAKGAGIIKITDAHLSVMDSSRVCYACSSITDPTCWSPERKTTVKYCARGRDSCVTKTYKGKDSLVVIRDCSSACDDALPVLGKKYESCSICGNDLCNNLYVDANGASTIYTRNTIGIMIFSWLIKHYFPYQNFL
ncbi:uncharacterized protein LOC113231328 isoform X2 [Hyposmocoma kahamanoa]|uniref:uncharacterized protein LOC113231328 isoform X2 n=1 Tax=Hyposmocoma kahamanoa TaxID=1477025 RepID=UPI000E6D8BE1|nr:uncharacterized protein LOC113231328 isoform X2 [Hyposmocoma kahamanoa]